MITSVVVLLLVLLAALSVLLLRRHWRRLQRAQPPPLPTRHLFNLRIGDIVQARGQDWVVEDRLLYEESGGFQWLEYRLQDGAESRWLSVCEDDELEVAWYRKADPAERAEPASAASLRDAVPEDLAWAGRRYRKIERGSATLRAEARVLNRRVGVCTFADYEAVDGGDGPDGLISLEWWGGGGHPAGEFGRSIGLAEGVTVEMAVGERLDPGLLTLLPGDGVSVYRP